MTLMLFDSVHAHFSSVEIQAPLTMGTPCHLCRGQTYDTSPLVVFWENLDHF